MGNEIKKLKRGLKDISPLFSEKEKEKAEEKPEELKKEAAKEVVAEVTSEIPKVCAVVSPDLPGDSLFLNTLLASQVAGQQRPCHVLSLSRDSGKNQVTSDGKTRPIVREKYGEDVTRTMLFWNEFSRACEPQHWSQAKFEGKAPMIFLDFEYEAVPGIDSVLQVVDKLILLLRPNFESFKEAYKILKTAYYFNKNLEYFILFEGDDGDDLGGFVYESFSKVVSHHLGVQLLWLGCLDLSQGFQEFNDNLVAEHLFINPANHVDSPEKLSLVNYLHDQISEPAA